MPLPPPVGPADAAGHPPVLVLDRVSRRFGHRLALAPLSVTVAAGAVGLVCGANGAGKTTLLRIAAGLLRPTTGSRQCRGRAVYLRPGSGARPAQSVRAAVTFAAAAAGRGGAEDAALAEAGLAAHVDRRVGSLSAGERARLLLALTLATAPALACLDEPTAHLDDEGRDRAAAVLARLAAHGTAVLLTTHDPALTGWAWDTRVQLVDGAVAW